MEYLTHSSTQDFVVICNLFSSCNTFQLQLTITFRLFLFQTSRDESRTSSSQHDKNNSKEILEETLRAAPPYPMIVTPPGGGYWLDGFENESRQNSNSHQHGPTAPWRSKIECDDTAKCYRRFFLGRVSFFLRYLFPILCKCFLKPLSHTHNYCLTKISSIGY
ncbi:hypothetical protein WDU94_005264 [Cyamophila willieti]